MVAFGEWSTVVVEYDEEGEVPQTMVVVHFIMDCVDAMGANMINTVAEHLLPQSNN